MELRCSGDGLKMQRECGGEEEDAVRMQWRFNEAAVGRS